jgi:hypothetical protein
MTVKFFYNGVRIDGVLFRVSYSLGPYNEASNLPKGTITMYEKDYKDFPRIEGITVVNDSDPVTDYIERDKILIYPNSPYYSDARRAIEKHNERIKVRFMKKYGNKKAVKVRIPTVYIH